MSDTHTLADLIARLEAATGPSRELDFWCWWWGKAVHDGQPPDADYAAANIRRADAPLYTASIDAALTLVLDDACWTISVPRQPDMSGRRYWASLRSNHPGARGSTPAIALCIAALKARSQP
jgi:hypothetical protein